MRRPHVVILVHGIRTQAEWMERAAATLETDPSIRVRRTRYGFFDVIRFLLPFEFVRRRPVRRIARLIRDEQANKPERISLIAHSFGTYILSRLLLEEPDIEFHRVILCGSIVQDDFDWASFRHRLATDRGTDWPVVNDCGMRDLWPVLARSVTWGYGSSGRFGFGHTRVRDRFHNAGHGEFFSEGFVRRFWLPYLLTGDVVEGELDRPTTPWWISVLSIVHVKYVLLLCVLVATTFYAFNALKKQQRQPPPVEVVAPIGTPSGTHTGESPTIGGDATTDRGDGAATRPTSDQWWSPRYGLAACKLNGRFWLTGGHKGSNSPGTYLGDVWSSSDGTNWQREVEAAPWPARTHHALVAHAGAMWLLGGMNATLGQGYVYFADVWKSADGRAWQRVTEDAPWGPRWQHASVAHNGYLWVLGGASLHDGSDPNVTLHRGASEFVNGRQLWVGGSNDVWRSRDGRNWDRVAKAPWRPRWAHAATSYSGLLWIFGGYDGASFVSDVWYSSDGIRWSEATPSAAWAARAGHTVTVFDERLWLLGGFHREFSAGTLLNEGLLWSSADGINWTRHEFADKPLQYRGDHAVVATSDSLLILGGRPGKQDLVNNEVWRLTPSKSTIVAIGPSVRTGAEGVPGASTAQ